MTSTLWMTMPRLYCAAGSFLLPLLRNRRFTSYSIRALNTVFHNLTHVTIEGERRERRQSVRRFWMEFDLKSEPTLSAQRRSRPWDARCTLDSTLRRVLYSKRKSKDISLSPQSTHQCVITNRRKRRSTLDHWASGVWLHFTTFGGAMWEVKKTFSQSPWHFAGREWSWKVELSLSLSWLQFYSKRSNAARKCEICQTKAWNISPGPCRAFYAIFIQLGRLLANHHHKPSSMQISFSL